MKNLVIFGAGDIAELAFYYFQEDTEYNVSGFVVDKCYRTSNTFQGLPLIDFEIVDKIFPKETHHAFVALSYSKLNTIRAAKVFEFNKKGYFLGSYLSSHANILTKEPIGRNCFILEDNTIQPYVKIGDNCTLWSGNHIGHHSILGNNVFISSHVVVSGGVKIGNNCFLGVNSTISDHITIGDNCILGANSLMLNDADSNGVYKPSATERSKVPSNRLRSF